MRSHAFRDHFESTINKSLAISLRTIANWNLQWFAIQFAYVWKPFNLKMKTAISAIKFSLVGEDCHHISSDKSGIRVKSLCERKIVGNREDSNKTRNFGRHKSDERTRLVFWYVRTWKSNVTSLEDKLAMVHQKFKTHEMEKSRKTEGSVKKRFDEIRS